jgi:chromosome segregation ATPase
VCSSDLLTGRVSALEASLARGNSAAAAQDRRVDGLDAQLQALRTQADVDRAAAQDALKRLQATQADLDERGRKLESLTDLLSVMKRDLDSNNEELVEVKQTLKRLDAATPAASLSPQTAWWDAVLGWRYLPVVAVGLSAVALGVAAAH